MEKEHLNDSKSKIQKEKKPSLFHPYSRRFHLLLLLTTGFFSTTFMRMHLAITMTCMINSTAISILETAELDQTITLLDEDIISNISIITNSGGCSAGDGDQKRVIVDYGGDIEWTQKQQNIIISGTFWGALLTCLPSMFLVQNYSPRFVLLVAVLIYASSTLITPMLAERIGYLSVFFARLFMGIGEGVVIPAINTIIAFWYPVQERSTVLALFTAGNQLAGAVGNPIAAGLCASSLGWSSIFYSIATFAILWCIIWLFTSSSHPHESGAMMKSERTYLEKHVTSVHHNNKGKLKVPYMKIMTSPAFHAQLQGSFVFNVVVTFIQFYLPSYLKDVMQLGVVANGAFIAVPNICMFVMKVFIGMSMDKLKEKKMISPTMSVKVAQSIASFGSAVCFIGIAFLVDCSTPMLALALFTLMYCSFGGFTSGFYTSLLSLAPKYTATLSSLSQFASMLGRLVVPIIVSVFKTKNTPDEWSNLFILFAVITFASGVLFLIFGSGDVQPWAKDPVRRPTSESEQIVVLVERARSESMCL